MRLDARSPQINDTCNVDATDEACLADVDKCCSGTRRWDDSGFAYFIAVVLFFGHFVAILDRNRHCRLKKNGPVYRAAMFVKEQRYL
jgi:hypothetical protein